MRVTSTFDDDEWLLICQKAATRADITNLSDQNILRASHGMPPRKNGGIRPGGFEPNNKHNPRSKKPPQNSQ